MLTGLKFKFQIFILDTLVQATLFFTDKMLNQISETMVRLHDVLKYDNWKSHISKTETISVPLTATLLDCAAPCILKAESENCDFFIFEPNSYCYFGEFDKIDGEMTSTASSFHIYVNKGICFKSVPKY